jgi:putative ABC transport system permease protein
MIPMSVARSRFANMHEIRDIYIRAVNWDSVPQIQSDASALLKKNHPGYAEGVDVKFFPERIKTIQNAVLLVKIFLLAAAAVTLILAGIGITNVMLAAVRERTTEIGLKKAIGATEKNIVRQFLLESVTISVFGAFFGILFGTVSIELLKQVFQTVPNYSVLLLSLIGGVVFSAVLGILSGIIPARKAGKLDVADAMRFE